MVLTSWGISILLTTSIFFGSAERPLSLQEWPKKETFGSLNCIFSGLRVRLFFLHTFKKFRRFPSYSLSVFPKTIMSSAIPVTPGTLKKIVSSFHWNMSCAMIETYWKLGPLEPSNVQSHSHQFSGIWVQFHHPVSFLLKSAMVNLVIPWNFPSISSYSMCSIVSLQGFIQVPGSRQILSFFCDEWSSVMESAGTFFPLLQNSSPIQLALWLAPKLLIFPNFRFPVESFL